MNRMLKRLKSEDGAVSLLGTVAILGALAAFSIVFLMLGSATTDQRNSSTAADAAALGGARHWADTINFSYQANLASPTNATFWAFAGHSATSFAVGSAASADAFAAANNNELLSYLTMAPAKTYAKVRNFDTIEKSDTVKMRAESYAVLKVKDRGVCLRGGQIGLFWSGVCWMSMPPGLDPKAPPPPGFPPETTIHTRLVNQ